MKSKLVKLFTFLIAFILLIVVIFLFYILFNIMPVNRKDKTYKSVVIPSGTSRVEIAEILEKEGIIRNAKVFYYYYTKIKKVNNIYAATYMMRPNMKISEVLDELKSGGENTDTIFIIFKEGLNMRGIIKTIEENTDITSSDILSKLSDEEYIDSLIDKYWFLTDAIKNKDIYYSLEGYLFPETYNIDKSSSIEDIFKVMLDQTDIVLTKYKKNIESSSYTIHEIITLASVVQLEGYTKDDFKNVASTFLNRLNLGMDLGSCVTSYYGVRKDMTSDLTVAEINDSNPYNTRAAGMEGKLPIGPISNPSKNALIAVIKPISTDYLYFVSDKNNKLYFTKTYEEHTKMISKLQDEGLWYEW